MFLRRKNSPNVQGITIAKFIMWSLRGGRITMRHCCKFKADDIYYLKDTEIYTSRKLSIGFCPICKKPVSELYEEKFNGEIHKILKTGYAAQSLVMKYKSDILYSMQECNYKNSKYKPYGWIYGINKTTKINGKTKIKQFACDFYGNKEVVKVL